MSKTCDVRCYQLAEDWLSDGNSRTPDKGRAMTLACAIQQTIEDTCEEWDAYDNDPHERAAARARANNFEETGGKDWT